MYVPAGLVAQSNVLSAWIPLPTWVMVLWMYGLYMHNCIPHKFWHSKRQTFSHVKFFPSDSASVKSCHRLTQQSWCELNFVYLVGGMLKYAVHKLRTLTYKSCSQHNFTASCQHFWRIGILNHSGLKVHNHAYWPIINGQQFYLKRTSMAL